MGVLDKLLDVLHLNSDDEDEMYNDDYEEDYEEEPAKPKVSRKERKEAARREEAEERISPEKAPKSPSKVTPIRSVKKPAPSGMEVCVIKPTSVEDAREITDTLLNERTVVLNVEGLDVEVAQRIIDFTSGSCYAINGNLQKISGYIFIITPASVDISGDFLNRMDGFDPRGLQAEF